MPVANETIDVIISNCVINLSPTKDKVFKEAFRVLKPGGRLMVSDIVLTKELPSLIKNNMSAYVGCISGAIIKEEYLALIKNAGFEEIKVVDESSFSLKYTASDDIQAIAENNLELSKNQIENLEDYASSIKVFAKKP